MAKSRAVLFLLAVNVFGQTCLKYGAPVALSGTLLLKDEAGYNQFTLLKLVRAICTVDDPNALGEPLRRQSGIREIQSSVYGDDPDSNELRDRLERLIGKRVVIKGALSPAATGYHRTPVQLSVEMVDPVDMPGRQALSAVRPAFAARDVSSYEVTIDAGRRLVIDARESGSGTQLLPASQYAPHWMTGGEVLYVNCRDGYERHLISSTDKTDGICFDGDLCGLSAFPARLLTLKFRCTKKP